MELENNPENRGQEIATLRALRNETLPSDELRFAEAETARLRSLLADVTELEGVLSVSQQNRRKTTSRHSELESQLDQTEEVLSTSTEVLKHLNERLSADAIATKQLSAQIIEGFGCLLENSDATLQAVFNEIPVPPIESSAKGKMDIKGYSLFASCARSLINQAHQFCPPAKRHLLETLSEHVAAVEDTVKEYVENKRLLEEACADRLQILTKLLSLKEEQSDNATTSENLEHVIRQVQTDISYKTADITSGLKTFTFTVDALEQHVYGTTAERTSERYEHLEPEEAFARYKKVRGYIDLLLGERPKNPFRYTNKPRF